MLDKGGDAPTHEYVVTEAEVRLAQGEDYQGRALRTPDSSTTSGAGENGESNCLT